VAEVDERVAWLTARLDELDRRANAAGGDRWRASESGIYPEDASQHPGPFAIGPYGHLDEGRRRHIALSDPRSVLARVGADRRILARHVPERKRIALIDENGGETSFGFYVCDWCYPALRWNQTRGRRLREWPCDEVLDLLAAHRHAPGFRKEWLDA
jgi:hypothetical protein